MQKQLIGILVIGLGGLFLLGLMAGYLVEKNPRLLSASEIERSLPVEIDDVRTLGGDRPGEPIRIEVTGRAITDEPPTPALAREVAELVVRVFSRMEMPRSRLGERHGPSPCARRLIQLHILATATAVTAQITAAAAREGWPFCQ